MSTTRRFSALIRELAETYPLHPDWDATCLNWQLAHAARNGDARHALPPGGP